MVTSQNAEDIDRNDPQDAQEVFRRLVPDSAARAVARLLARVVVHADSIESGSWSLSLFREKIRLNVGQTGC